MAMTEALSNIWYDHDWNTMSMTRAKTAFGKLLFYQLKVIQIIKTISHL
jgi:hypothetical protein